jgi:uncharacterized metal-binding protein
MAGDHLFFTGIQNQVINLKMNTLWRLQYYLLLLRKKEMKKKYSNESLLKREMPLVYSCSGCSSAAQMANYIALQLDRNGVAEMSCIAGVGGNVKKLVRTAFSGRKIITIDGCPLACSRACLGNHSINAHGHFELTAMGVKKRDHEDFDPGEANKILKRIREAVTEIVQ